MDIFYIKVYVKRAAESDFGIHIDIELENSKIWAVYQRCVKWHLTETSKFQIIIEGTVVCILY